MTDRTFYNIIDNVIAFNDICFLNESRDLTSMDDAVKMLASMKIEILTYHLLKGMSIGKAFALAGISNNELLSWLAPIKFRGERIQECLQEYRDDNEYI